MSDGIMFLITIVGIIIGTFFLYLINKGIELCKENNSLGVLLLFFTLNVFGLIFGCCIISNLRYKEKKTLYDKLDKFLDKQENNISQQS